jgi:Rod binding domain-containing protein
MPIISGTPIASGTPIVSAASEPAFVRNGSQAVKSAYREARGFEEMFAEELTKSMGEAGGLAEGGQEGGEGQEGASSSLVSSMMPQTLAEALTRGGGLGLATRLTSEIDPGAISTTKAGS